MLAQYTINFTLSDHTLDVLYGIAIAAYASISTTIWIKMGLTAALRAEIRAVRARRKARNTAA
jgi:hypothetical protein